MPSLEGNFATFEFKYHLYHQSISTSTHNRHGEIDENQLIGFTLLLPNLKQTSIHDSNYTSCGVHTTTTCSYVTTDRKVICPCSSNIRCSCTCACHKHNMLKFITSANFLVLLFLQGNKQSSQLSLVDNTAATC